MSRVFMVLALLLVFVVQSRCAFTPLLVHLAFNAHRGCGQNCRNAAKKIPDAPTPVVGNETKT